MRSVAVAWVLRLWANRSQLTDERPPRIELDEAERALQDWLKCPGATAESSLERLAERFEEYPDLLDGFSDLDKRYLRALGDSGVQHAYLFQTGRKSLQTVAVEHFGGGAKFRERVADLNGRLAHRLMPLITQQKSDASELLSLVRCLRGSPPSIAQLYCPDGEGQLPAGSWFDLQSARADGDVPAYFERTVDRRLDEYVERLFGYSADGDRGAQDRILLVTGPAKSGRTRSIVEALNRHEDARVLPVHQLIDPRSLDAYTRLAHPASVLLIDDLDRVLSSGIGVSTGRQIVRQISLVAAAGATVILTADPSVLDVARRHDYGLGPEDLELLRNLLLVRVDARLDESEAERFGVAVGHRFGENHAGPTELRRLMGSLLAGPQGDPVRQASAAIIRALCDSTLFVGHSVSAESLRSLAEPYWRTEQPAKQLTMDLVESALGSLNIPVGPADSIWAAIVHDHTGWSMLEMLRPHLLLDHVSLYRPSDVEALRAGLAMLSMTDPSHGDLMLEAALEWFGRATEMGNAQAGWLMAELDERPADDDGLSSALESAPWVVALLDFLDEIESEHSDSAPCQVDRIEVSGSTVTATALFLQLQRTDWARRELGLEPLCSEPPRFVDGGRKAVEMAVSVRGQPPVSIGEDISLVGFPSRNAALHEVLGRLAHDHYLDRVDNGVEANSKESHRRWNALSETFRRANIAQAVGMLTSVHSLGLAPGPFRIGQIRSLTAQERLAFGELEHERWHRERLAEGWVLGPELSEPDRVHPDLRPWSELTPEVQRLDLDVADRLPALLAMAGLALVQV